jgi:hypothetical protein
VYSTRPSIRRKLRERQRCVSEVTRAMFRSLKRESNAEPGASRQSPPQIAHWHARRAFPVGPSEAILLQNLQVTEGRSPVEAAVIYCLPMSQPLTANDLLPLVARLDARERERLAQLIGATAARDAAVYASTPIKRDEFSSDEESLGWDADGWEDVK